MNQSRIWSPIAILSLLLLIAGCASTPKVYTDYDARENFSDFRHFSWVQTPPMLKAGDYPVPAVLEARMTAAIKQELVIRGYSFVTDPSEADFTVLYTMGARDKIVVERRARTGYFANRVDWGWGAIYYPFFLHFPFGRDYSDDIEIQQYSQGTIAIDVFNAQSKQPIWHTRSSKRLNDEDFGISINEAAKIVEHLLQDFPYKGCRMIETPTCKPFASEE